LQAFQACLFGLWQVDLTHFMSSDVTQSTGFYDFLAWLEVNKMRVVAATVVVVVLALAISFTIYHKNQREIAADAALFKLGLPMLQSDATIPATAKDFQKIALDFSGTSAAERAMLESAGLLFSEGNFVDAQAQFKKFQTEYGSSRLAGIAAIGVAACLDAQTNKTDEAIAAYKEVLTRFPSESVAGQARIALGRIYEAKKQPDVALKYYDEILKASVRSGWASEATEFREMLLAKNPNLASNSVPAVVKPMPQLKATPAATNAANPAKAATNAAK
jgi:predicted negative regulator of RcsB-dependent stress response